MLCVFYQGGQVVKYTAMLACGNYHGVIGYAKAKGSAVPIALQKVRIYDAVHPYDSNAINKDMLGRKRRKT